jgi:ABC-type branched-subunit amino acid transport system substrate-binding protein
MNESRDLRVTRRAFLAAAPAALLTAHALRLRAGPAANSDAFIGLVLPTQAPAHVRDQVIHGARLGIEEADHTARLLGRSLAMRVAEPASTAQFAHDAARLVDEGAFALVGGSDAEEAALLTGATAGRAVAFNVACGDDALRGERCAPHLFHVAASDAMRRAALAGAPSGTTAVHWHPALFRFGAEQLTTRYHDRFGGSMHDLSWTAWFALKTLGEATLRARSTEAAALSAFLLAPRTRFDGHKGVALTFRPQERQLRQPLYLVDGAGAVAGERPVVERGADPGPILDRFGSSAAGGCQAEP